MVWLLRSQRATASRSEAARPLQQDGAPRHIGPVDARDALVRRGEELLLAGEGRRMLADAGADADQLAHPGPGDHVGHAAVQLVVRIPALRDVRQHERRRTPQRHRVEVVQARASELMSRL